MKFLPLALLCLGTVPLHAADFERDLSPDRPDTTESPISVPAGGIQIESSFWDCARDKDGLTRLETWTLAETNFKIGLDACSDLQFVVRPWIRERVRTAGLEDVSEGFGDLEIRWKRNLWGNDGGRTAFALMPFVSIPSQTSVSTGEWEGGLIAPFSVELAEGVGLGLMAELDRVWDDGAGRHEWAFLHTAVVGIDLTERCGLYLEYIGNCGTAGYEATASAGITWAQSENVQWDLGGTLGLNDAAGDFSLFQGITVRF